METIKGGTTSTINRANEISQNGQNFSIQFQKIGKSTRNGPINLFEIGEVLYLIKED